MNAQTMNWFSYCMSFWRHNQYMNSYIDNKDVLTSSRLPITRMRNRDQYQNSIEMNARLSSRGVKKCTLSLEINE